jgi:hypothetical protein
MPGESWYRLLWIGASFHFALVYTLNTRPMLDLAAFAQGTERMPFQYRAMTAWLFYLVQRLVHFPSALARHLPPRMSSPDDFTILGLAFVSMVAAVFFTRRSLEAVTRRSPSAGWWALLVLFMAYFHYLLEFGHPCCTPLQMPYDLPSLAFFAAGTWLILTRRTGWLYLLIFVAMFNRESTVFLAFLYFLYEMGLHRGKLSSFLRPALHALAMFAICVAILHGLHRLFPHAQPAGETLGPFENHILDNFGYFLRPFYWASFLSMFGFSWLYLYANWKSVPGRGIRYAMAIGPVMLAAMWVVGVLSEIRIFGELISFFVVALALLLRRQFGLHDDPDAAVESAFAD